MKKLGFMICFFVFLFGAVSGVFAQKRPIILVTPFKNDSGKTYQWFSAGVTNTVINDLARIKDLDVVTEEARMKALEEMQFSESDLVDKSKAVELGKMLSANLIFSGSYTIFGNRIRVFARLIDVKQSRVRKSIKLDGKMNDEDVWEIQDEIVIRLIQAANDTSIEDIQKIKLASREKAMIREKATSNLNAFQWYSRGLEVKSTNPREALGMFEKALQIDPDYRDALKEGGKLSAQTLNDYERGERYLSKLLALMKNEKSSLLKAETHQYLGRIYTSRNDFKRALHFLKKADREYRKAELTHTRNYALFLLDSGKLVLKFDKFDLSMKLFRKAERILKKTESGDTTNYATVVSSMGFNLMKRRQYKKALHYFRKNLRILEKNGLKNTSLYATALNNLGLVLGRTGNSREAERIFRKAMVIRERAGLKNTNGYAAAVNNLAANLFRRGEYRDALENMLRVLETLEKIGLDKTDNYATVMNNVGTCYVKLNQENRAAEYYRKSSGIYEKIGLNSTYGYARTIINLHSVLQNRGSGEASRREVERAMDILEKLKLQRTASYQLGKSMLAKMNRGSDSPNLLKNPGFEQGWAHWSRYWGKGRGKRKIDSSVKRSGRKSAKLKFYSNFGPHIYKTFSQRISGLKRNTKYRFECWVRGNGLKRKGALFATADGRWLQRMSTGKGSYGWKKYTFVFDTGNQNYFDIRFVIQDRGTVWIDDVYFGKAN